MPFFAYTAKNEFGENLRGKVEARNVHQAASVLKERNLLVIQLKPLTEDAFAPLKAMFVGVKTDDIVNFTRQLSTMISAGLPLASSLSILVQQSKPEMSRLTAAILEDVEGGISFADALEKHPDAFDNLYTQLVRAGELGGVLDEVLARLAENMEKSKAFRAKTKGAMIYPVIVLLAMVIVGFIMMIFVIPKLTAMYTDFGAELPLATRALIGISEFMKTFWWLFIGGGIGGFLAFKRWIKTESGRAIWHTFILRIPIIGVLNTKIVLTEFARTTSLLIGAGVSLLNALEIVTKGVSNQVYQSALEDATKDVEKGVPLSEALERGAAFPPILFQMTAVGEETGKLDEILKKLSDYFEQESEQAVKNLTAAMEPLIMVVLGIGVGAMVIAIIMPIYNLTSQF
ncbi:MAG: type II secretion system F family protein [Candidatus Pacebacteria bacterium]|nr:type II secretion system F family protein [Candidatus Paceibacterota bacterium]PIR60064.1 MAG: pilus assembly protein PilC [Candidatus Pacebacteria bacterium CG10_big_fil_rev_8_21_14_0_10_44_54]